VRDLEVLWSFWLLVNMRFERFINTHLSLLVLVDLSLCGMAFLAELDWGKEEHS